MVTGADLRKGFEALGVSGRNIVLHSSLRSFGGVAGGLDAVVEAVADSVGTVMVPAFNYRSVVAPPVDDRPERNAYDYSTCDTTGARPVPFRIEDAPIEPRMGAIARAIASLPQTRRSNHPWHSWAACGPIADELVNSHPWESTNLPLETLSTLGGYVVLMGVGLSSCTAVHVGEERAGRRPFIRWAVGEAGAVRRVGVAGCGKGFDRLTPDCSHLFVDTRVGGCLMRAARLDRLIETVAAVIRANPRATVCSDECVRCRDGARGGPAPPTPRRRPSGP